MALPANLANNDISDSTGHWFGNSYPSNPGVQITGADHNHS